MCSGLNYSSNMKKYVILLGFIALMFICIEANDSRKMEEIHRESKLAVIQKTTVSIICASTDYKEECRSSLATVRSPDPRNIIRVAFDIAISSIRTGIDRGLIDLKSTADEDVHTRAALNTCRELMDEAIDDILRTRDKFGLFMFTRLSDFVEDLCVWLSGSITYQQTCIDGFEGINSNAAIIMERVLRRGQHLTSNGLAIASNLDYLLKAFRIPIPFFGSGGRGGILGFGSSPEAPPPSFDSPENLPMDSPVDSSENRTMDSSEQLPQNTSSSETQPMDSSETLPRKTSSSETQPMDSSETFPRKTSSSETQPTDSSETLPRKTSSSGTQQPMDSSEKLPRKISSSETQQPMDSSMTTPQNSTSTENRNLLEFPRWLTRHTRKLLARRKRGRGNSVRANVVVAKDGSGKFKSITQALALVPKNNKRKFVIHIKQGVYKEKVEVTKKMHNVMFIGDGPTKTIITGDIAFLPNRIGTYQTASVAVNGDYFVAKDIGFENTAGAARHQAVALRVSADFAVFFNCHMNGYQDTLYVHTHRQFYRNCRISGTIDFVFGDAKAVFQNCIFVIRRPMANQQCIVTAQGRKDRRETTGIVIHNSRIIGDASYRPVKAKNRAFLGRPWKEYSRTIIMNTEIDDVIDPEGWLKWNETFALNTLFYAEYRNRGRGSGQARRVRWKGIRRISDREARSFSPGDFLRGSTWIPQTRVPFNPN